MHITQKGFSTIILVIIIIVLGVAGVVSYVALTKEGEPVGQVTPIPTLTSTPTPTSDVTANWKTYRNNELSFEFKYPNDWLLNEDDQNNRVTISSVETVQKEEERIRMCYDDDPTTKCISEGVGFDIIFELESSEIAVDHGTVSFGDNLFIKYEAMGLFSETHYKLDHNGKIYDFAILTVVGTSNIGQILSTFKFTN